MNEILYRGVKNIETMSQSLIFSLPMQGSDLSKALRIPPGQEWKLNQLVESLIWMEKVAKDSAVSIYMEGKE